MENKRTEIIGVCGEGRKKFVTYDKTDHVMRISGTDVITAGVKDRATAIEIAKRGYINFVAFAEK